MEVTATYIVRDDNVVQVQFIKKGKKYLVYDIDKMPRRMFHGFTIEIKRRLQTWVFSDDSVTLSCSDHIESCYQQYLMDILEKE